GDERLGLADGTRDTFRVQAVRVAVHELPRMPLELLLEHEPGVLERPALPVRVAQQRQRGVARCAEDRQGIGRQAGCLPDRLDARPFEAPDFPALAITLGHRDVPRAERKPRLREPQALVEISERVELDRRALTGVLALPAQL